MKEKFAIVTNGGGMHCAYSAGVLCSLAENYNIKEPNILIGSSGSTGSLLYYIAQQYKELKNLWTDKVSSKKLINFKRLHPLVDINYLIDEIIKKQQPLNIKKIKQSKIEYFISATEYRTGKTKYFTKKSRKNIFEILRAANAVPIIFNKKIKINNIDYIDGSISAPPIINVEKAISEGATKILIILDYGNLSSLETFIWKTYSYFVNKQLRKRLNQYLHQRKNIFEKRKNIKMIIIGPPKITMNSALDNNKNRLQKTFNQGYKDLKNNSKFKKFLKI